MDIPQSLKDDAISLLQDLIRTPSFSKEEDKTAEIIRRFFDDRSIPYETYLHNTWAVNKHFDRSKPTILLNSHHDTVKPNPGYTRDPFEATIEDGKLYGLGSNDAGGCLVSLINTFVYFYDKEGMNYNLMVAPTAEEEISGKNGLEVIIPKLGELDFAIVGEPTNMNAAIAEKGLMVLDCKAKGKSGHAAREEGDNAIYKAIKDINWITSYKFDRVSDALGPVKMSVTIIGAGTQHNVVPEYCDFTIDVRTTDAFSNEDVLTIIKDNLESEVTPRSFRLKPSSIPPEHPVVTAAIKYGATTYGSPTTSDQALLDIPSLKMGPGESGRSHTADEFIFVEEIEDGVERYIRILSDLLF